MTNVTFNDEIVNMPFAKLWPNGFYRVRAIFHDSQDENIVDCTFFAEVKIHFNDIDF